MLNKTIYNYSIGNKEIQFDKTEFLSNSKNVGRDFKDYSLNEDSKSTELKIKLGDLKPIREALDMNEVFMNIVRKTPLNESMIITKDFFVISNNHVLASKSIIESNDNYVDVIMINENIEDLMDEKVDEDYGMQGQEASGRMGDVVLPTVSGSSEIPKMDGSGDIPASVPKGKSELYTSDYLKNLSQKYSKKIEELLEMKFPINESLSEPLNVPIKKELMDAGNENIISNLEKMFFVKFVANESLNEDANLKLDKHFESFEDIINDPNLENFVNKPISRKVLKVDEPFSCNTLEGITQGKAGDYVVMGFDKEIYPCDADILHKTYIKVE